jgi:hypothetical protein
MPKPISPDRLSRWHEAAELCERPGGEASHKSGDEEMGLLPPHPPVCPRMFSGL